MYPCAKGHPHNTNEGKNRCDLKYADKRMERQLKKGLPLYEPVIHDPPLMLDKGGIPIVIFRSAVRVA